MTENEFNADSARHFLTLSSSVVMPMQLTVHHPRPFTDALMRELVTQLAPLLRRFVKYDDVPNNNSNTSNTSNNNVNKRQRRLVSFVDIESNFKPGTMKEHREGELWFAYTIVRADNNANGNCGGFDSVTHLLKAESSTTTNMRAFDVVPWLLIVVVGKSPRQFAASFAPPSVVDAVPISNIGASAAAATTSKFFKPT
jgi:hypothetical protein